MRRLEKAIGQTYMSAPMTPTRPAEPSRASEPSPSAPETIGPVTGVPRGSGGGGQKAVASTQPRIYLVGAHNVGKSSLARWIARRYGLPMIHETAREVLSRFPFGFDKLRLDVEAVSQYQRDVFAEQIARETAMGDGGFVSDRAFDNLAYFALHGRGLSDLVGTEACENYVASVREHGTVFFIRPHGGETEADGVRGRRDLDMSSVWQVDGMVTLMLQMWDVPHVTVDCTSPRDRQNLVEMVMNRSVA